MISDARLDQIVQRFQFLEARMATGADPSDIASLAREYSELKPVVDQIELWRRLTRDIADAKAMLSDPDMHSAFPHSAFPQLRIPTPAVPHSALSFPRVAPPSHSYVLPLLSGGM